MKCYTLTPSGAVEPGLLAADFQLDNATVKEGVVTSAAVSMLAPADITPKGGRQKFDPALCRFSDIWLRKPDAKSESKSSALVAADPDWIPDSSAGDASEALTIGSSTILYLCRQSHMVFIRKGDLAVSWLDKSDGPSPVTPEWVEEARKANDIARLAGGIGSRIRLKDKILQ